MTTAASTGWGIAWTRPGTNRSISSTSAAATSPVSWVLAPDWKATAVREPLVLTGKPEKKPGGEVGRADAGQLLVAVDLVARRGRRSRPTSRSCRRWRPARCPTAAANSSGMSAESAPPGSDGTGKPCGSTPMTSTRRARRGRGRSRGRSPRRPRSGCPGVRGDSRLRPRMMRQAQQADARAPRGWSGHPRRPGRRRRPRRRGRSASVEKPNSFGSWPMRMTTASPARYPVRTGFESRSATKPSLPSAGADVDEPDEEREHPRERDRLLLVAGGERQDGGRDHRAERRVGTQDQDRRRPDEGVRDEADHGRVQPGDGRQPGQLRVGHPLGHEQRDEHDAGDQVARQERSVVGADDSDAGHPALDPGPRACHHHPRVLAARVDGFGATPKARCGTRFASVSIGAQPNRHGTSIARPSRRTISRRPAYPAGTRHPGRRIRDRVYHRAIHPSWGMHDALRPCFTRTEAGQRWPALNRAWTRGSSGQGSAS